MSKALITSISIVALADGLLRTALGIRMPAEGFSSMTVGVIMSSYWGGYILGGISAKMLIQRVGRIRAFAGFAGLVTTAVLATALGNAPLLWGKCRFATGFGCAVLFIAAESWLNIIATPRTRGSLFATYIAATYFAMGAGQLLLIVVPPTGSEILVVVAISFSLSFVPLVLSPATAPSLGQNSHFGLLRFIQIAPFAALCCAFSGVASAAFYALVPTFLNARGMSFSDLSIWLTAAIFGGLVSQWPLGRLSDLFDRRLILLFTAIGGTLTATVLGLMALEWRLLAFSGLGALHVGFLAALYPLALEQAGDKLKSDEIVAASGALVIANGSGSAFGPLLAGFAMQTLSPAALFIVIGTACLIITFVCVASLLISRPTALKSLE